MTGSIKPDGIERRILAKLQMDGRMTNQALADEVALSPSACLARVRRLESARVIEGCGARLDPWSLDAGLILFAEIWLKGQEPAVIARFETAIIDMSEIVEASYVSGAFDYLPKVVVPDMAFWRRLSEDLISLTPALRKSSPMS